MNFDIAPYDRSNPAHCAFVEDTFLRSLTTNWPWLMVPWNELRNDLRSRLRRPGVLCAIATVKDDPIAFLGWAAVNPAFNEIIYAYTIGAYRTRHNTKWEPRVASGLVSKLGVDLTKSTEVVFWTEITELLSKRPGWNLERSNGR